MDEYWTADEAIVEMPTYAYGKIEFANDESHTKPAKVRIFRHINNIFFSSSAYLTRRPWTR